MPAVRQKPASQLAFKRGGRAKVIPLSRAVYVPDPPEFITDEYAKTVWVAFWQSEVSGLVKPQHIDAVMDWIAEVQSRQVLRRTVEAEPVQEGSDGIKRNPLWTELRRSQGIIAQYRAKFGGTPLDQMRLTGQLDQAEQAESNIKARRDGRRPTLMPARKA